MKRVMSAALAFMFVLLIAQPAMVTKSSAASVAVTSVKLNVTELKWAIGRSGKFTATVQPSNATDKALTWRSSDSRVAIVGSTGTVKAMGLGKATITCASKSNPNIKAACVITVTIGMPVTSVRLSATALKWPIGASATFKVSVSPSNAISREVTWKSSNTKVATIDSTGKIKAVGYGKATITCTSKANVFAKATCAVTVGKAVKSIKLNTSSIPNWTVGKSGKFKTTILPADAINKAVVWKSSDPSIVSVTSTGIVVAKKPGQVIITCYSKYNSKVKATCKIVVLATSASNVVSYTQDKATGLFYVDQDNAWQRKYGFNRLYDWGAPITAMYYNTVRIKFNYGGIDWMVQLWKGQYGYAFIGCEIGVYTKPTTRTTDHYDCADNNHRMMMTMKMYQNDTLKFTRPYQSYWWATGFIPGSLTQYADRTELTMVARLDMYDTTMLKAFVKAIAESGFTYGKTAGKATPDTFTIRGKSIYFNWKALGQPSINSKVTFYSNGGTDIATMRGTAGEKLVAPADPTKDGYVFLGWDPALPSTYPVEALKTYAKWGTTIDFNSDGGTSVASISGQVGSTITYPANPTKNGYVFKGWSPSITTFPDSPSTTLKATWAPTSTIFFNSNGGSTVASITGEEGAKVTAPANPTKKGTTFSGWNPELPSTFPVDDLTVKAIWGSVITVTLNNNGGTGTTSLKGGAGDKLTLSDNPTRTGYTFTGWSPSLPGYFPDKSTTYTAQWKVNTVTISFDCDGGTSVASIKGNYGAAVTQPANPTKTNHTFTGWSPAVPSTFPAANLKCTAQWKVNQTTVSFDSDGGSAIASKTGDIGSTLTAPADPIKIGYVFSGWSPTLPKTFPDADAKYTAQWKKVDAATITFNTDGGSEIAPITGLYGFAVTKPADPTKAGYTFAGWSPEIPSTFPENSMTVKAIWAKNRITLSFDTNGGTAVAAIKGYFGNAVTAPADPTREGYKFDGWSPALPDTFPAVNTTYTAQWTAVTP